MAAVLSHMEAARACLVGVLNLVYLCRALPFLWQLVPILPLLKPGKPRGHIDSHRLISLLAAILKVLDKLLFTRIWPLVKAAVSPWQAGGILGADVVAWLASEVLSLRWRSATATYAAFIDGESAYCRPPADFVMEALRLIPGLREADMLLIWVILVSLWGTASILGGLYGRWKVECGIVQGGALSTALFVALLLPLYRKLKEAGVGILIPSHSGAEAVIALVAFIDDLLLLADTPRELQTALNIVFRWARRLRAHAIKSGS